MNPLIRQPLGWRSLLALSLFSCGFIGLLAGVPLSERPDVVTSSALTKAYYALGFFVVGGLDVGTPDGGPWWAQGLLWIAYFGCPLLTASAVIEAMFQVLKPARWQLRNIRDHTIIFGANNLTISYLNMLKAHGRRGKIVIVDAEFDPVAEQELKQTYGARTVVGDLTHEYFLRLLRLKRARRVLLFGEDDFQACEAASRILKIAPQLDQRVIVHCQNLRFMRSLANTDLAAKCVFFNNYNIAASAFVHTHLIDHFDKTANKDNVVIAGFGRFGQSVLEELHAHAASKINNIAVIDVDADRRVLVVAEQARLAHSFESEVFQGDIGNPEVWRRLTSSMDLSADEPTIILGTGREQENLRTALWMKDRFPNTHVYARTNDISQFALAVGAEHGIKSVSITQLVEQSIPTDWLN
ncbi:MAG: NAD-binding protein [Pseudomonadales bacterium]